MSNYYEKSDAKVRIAHELMNRGWNVEGYHADESDSMTDYWSPAHWSGIATKNGFILVVDNRYNAEAKEITKYNPKGNLSIDDREKISKLEQMTIERGCTVGEEENAKKLIEKIKEKISDQPAYEVVGMTTAHMGNPKGSIWHIEKDSKIYDKGNGLTKFSDMPSEYEFDIVKMEYTDRHKKVWTRDDENGYRVMEDRKLPDDTRKIINDFKSLILRFERVVNGMNSCGDGTEETEQAGQEQQVKAGYEFKTVTETKTGLKMVEVTDRKYVQVGDYIKTAHHCCYWKIIDGYMKKGTWKGIQEEKKAFTYEQVGKESRGFKPLKNAQRYYDYEFRMLKDIENGNIKIYELKEVTEAIQVEKWVKIDKSQKTYNSKSENKQEEKKEEQPKQTETKETINNEYIITADTDTRDDSKIWVVKLVKRVDSDTFNKIRYEVMKPIDGYYSRFKGGFIFKYDPTSKLINNTEPTETTEQEQPTEKQGKAQENNNCTEYDQQEIKDGFIYDCHFKTWDIPMTEIQEAITAINIPFIDWVEKIGFKGITAEQARQAKEISDINGSIFFIDNEIAINSYNTITDEQPENAEQEQETESNNVIDFEEYKNNSEVEEVEEKEHITEQQEDIFSKFDNIEINNNSRISAEDETFCKKEQEQYNFAITTMINLANEVKKNCGMDLLSDKWHTEKSTNKYLDPYKFREIKEITDGIKEGFISSIIYYFTDKYNITINKEKIVGKYSYDVEYSNILDEIFIQLGGYSFNEKAIKEIKDALKQQVKRGYDNSIQAEIKGKKVVFDSFFYIDSWDIKYKRYKVSYGSDQAFNKLLTAISHFEQGTTQNSYHGVYNNITQKEGDQVFKEHTLMCFKAESMKLYKNGKVEVIFNTTEYARQFAKEYCGYIEKSA